ncbi:hypothetical protein PMAYCL1PPCAC_25550, partial [Pristionchus mayeri]
RWEIDNATAKFIAGKTESEVFNEGGFKWSASAERDIANWTDFTLRCEANHNGIWKCNVNAELRVLRVDGTYYSEKNLFEFNNENSNQKFLRTIAWPFLLHHLYRNRGKAAVECHIEIFSSESGNSIFAAPNDMSNVILKIGENKLHVSKEYLAVHSPVFKILFFGDFAEKDKEEIEIKDIVYEEFLDLLHLLYLGTVDITDNTVPHLLKLADQFQIEDLLKESEKHLTHSNGIGEAKKLLLSDQYRLTSLKIPFYEHYN